jgi:hypothetical protein
MKTPVIKRLNFPEIIRATSYFTSSGKLAISENNLVYLDIDDAYVHQLFPLLADKQIQKPDYFGKNSAGAHITVIYPEENKQIANEDLGQQHSFLIKDTVTAQIGPKTYYVLLVESPSLLQIRRKYGLSDSLCFKGYAIGFHITIGVKVL